MRVAIITAGVLPVPPVKGGAVENLIYTIIKENDKNKNPIDIEVYSINCAEDINYPTNQKNTSYNFIENKVDNIFLKNKYIKKVVDRITDKYKYYPYLDNILDKIKNEKFDYIIIENRPQFVKSVSLVNNSKIILHLHNEHISAGLNSKEILDTCDKIIVVSNFVKSKILEEFNGYENKIYVLNNGIDTLKFKKENYIEQRKYLRRYYNFKDEDIVVIFSGRLIKEKGILELIYAMKKILYLDNIKLFIVGSLTYGSNKKNKFIYKLEKESIELNENIVFTGYVDYNDIPKLYSIADIAVVPSICEEGLPTSAIEAMSMNLPIIATIAGGMTDIVTEKCGFLIDINEKLDENIAQGISILYKDKKLREIMGKEARNIVDKKFKDNIYYQNLISILKEN